MTSSHRSEKNAQFYSGSVAGCLVPLDPEYWMPMLDTGRAMRILDRLLTGLTGLVRV